MTVALGTSTPTSMTVVHTSTSISPARNAAITASFSSLDSRPCIRPSRTPARGPRCSRASSSTTVVGGGPCSLSLFFVDFFAVAGLSFSSMRDATT